MIRHRQDPAVHPDNQDRKSTRLNSSHSQISYAVFCLKKKKKKTVCIRDSCYRVGVESHPPIQDTHVLSPLSQHRGPLLCHYTAGDLAILACYASRVHW